MFEGLFVLLFCFFPSFFFSWGFERYLPPNKHVHFWLKNILASWEPVRHKQVEESASMNRPVRWHGNLDSFDRIPVPRDVRCLWHSLKAAEIGAEKWQRLELDEKILLAKELAQLGCVNLPHERAASWAGSIQNC